MESSSVIVFDGVCNLCNGFVRFVIERDRSGVFTFAALQSQAGQRLVARHARQRALPDSVLLIENGRLYDRSTGALRIARRLRAPWPLVYALIVVPRPLRDWAYDVVSRNRYRWFGKRDTCMLPTPDLQRRFISD